MKYDLAKCNNLRWRADGGKKGFVRCYNGQATLLSDEMWLTNDGLANKVECNCNELYVVESYIETHLPGFEIVPRDPETYKDWQVGDIVKDDRNSLYEIEARLGNLVFLSGGGSYFATAYFICNELYRHGFRLVLTDYEKILLPGGKPERPLFKKGDRVLVRDANGDCWVMARFLKFCPDSPYPYSVGYLGCFRFKQCIPYNEKTWRLLDTTDNYKEE